MYIAMNRFKILKGKETEFENVWKNRDTHLKDVPGFKDSFSEPTADKEIISVAPHCFKHSILA